MRKIILLFNLLFSALIFCQTPAGFNGRTGAPPGLAWGQTDAAAIDFFNNLTSRPKKILTEKDIQGSPYFTEEFKLAKVFYGGRFEEGKQIYIRHNAYSDELEMATSQYQYASDQILLKTKEVFCEFEGKIFKLLPFISKSSGEPEIGYLQSVFEGVHYSVYLKETKVFMNAKKALTSLERSFPPRFVDNKTYYYSYNKETPKYLNLTKRTLKKMFESKLQAKKTLDFKESLENNITLIFNALDQQ